MRFQAGAERLRRRIATFVRQRLSAARSGSPPALPVFEPGGSVATVHQTREAIAASFLRGEGIEIGALHQPLHVPASARVKYVDRMTASELRRQYEELADAAFVETDIVDNGEQLTTIGDDTQDFVIANHFIEHCQNPIQAFQNLSRIPPALNRPRLHLARAVELLIFIWIPTIVSHGSVANADLVATDLFGLLVTIAAVLLLARVTRTAHESPSSTVEMGCKPPTGDDKDS
jgi:hypothetical protein